MFLFSAFQWILPNFILFPSLIAHANNSSTIKNKIAEIRHFCIILDLRGNVSRLSPFNMTMTVRQIQCLYFWGMFLAWRYIEFFFYVEGCRILSNLLEMTTARLEVYAITPFSLLREPVHTKSYELVNRSIMVTHKICHVKKHVIWTMSVAWDVDSFKNSRHIPTTYWPSLRNPFSLHLCKDPLSSCCLLINASPIATTMLLLANSPRPSRSLHVVLDLYSFFSLALVASSLQTRIVEDSLWQVLYGSIIYRVIIWMLQYVLWCWVKSIEISNINKGQPKPHPFLDWRVCRI